MLLSRGAAGPRNISIALADGYEAGFELGQGRFRDDRSFQDGLSAKHLRCLAPNSAQRMEFEIRNLKYWDPWGKESADCMHDGSDTDEPEELITHALDSHVYTSKQACGDLESHIIRTPGFLLFGFFWLTGERLRRTIASDAPVANYGTLRERCLTTLDSLRVVWTTMLVFCLNGHGPARDPLPHS